MKKRKIFWRLFSNFLAIGSLSLIVYFAVVVYHLYSSDLDFGGDRSEIYSFFVRNLAFTMLAMVFVMAVVSYFTGKKIAKPLEILEQKTKEAIEQRNDPEFIFSDYQTAEVQSLARCIGDLNSHLINRVNKVTTQKNEQEAIFMSLSEGVVALSSDMKIKRMNTKAKNYFGLENRFKKDLGFDEAISNPELREFVGEVLVSREPSETELELSEPILRSLKVTSAPYVNATSDEVGVILVLTDITKLKRLERYRTEFVANVSHELRTPLTNIQGYAETLLNPKIKEVPEKQTEFAEKIKDNSIRLKSMVEDLLYLANLDRQQTGFDEFQTSKVDLSFCVRRAMEYLKAKATSLNKEIVFEPSHESIEVNVNEGLFGQALINLIDNAIKYSGDSDKVFVKVYEDDGDVYLSVRDQGIGISESDLGRLFERFYRVDKDRSRVTGGSGLGLSIVKNILDLHQIELEVKSQIGKGSEFILKLPL